MVETDAVPSTNPTDEESPSPSTEVPTQITTSTEPIAPKSEPYEHTHSLSWVETIEATETSDGLMEYRCDCGYVEESTVITGAMAFVQGVVKKINEAPKNGVVEIKTELYTCYTEYIMSALRKRPDVALRTTYKASDKTMKVFTIPAGKAPSNAQFYGFTYLSNLYGLD